MDKISKDDIRKYLYEVKKAVKENKCRIAMNDKREDNKKLFTDYLLYEKDAFKIILSLQVTDFSEVVKNNKKDFEHENLYIFGKEVKLLEKYGSNERTVPLYIKFNKIEDKVVIVVSFHEQKYSLKYAFK